MTTSTDHVTSGFGTILAAEHALLKTIRDAIDHGTGAQRGGITRILEEHARQLIAIIALLEGRDKLLPFPERFTASDRYRGLLARPEDSRGDFPTEPLALLATHHRNLRHGIEVLIGCSGSHDREEASLREAVQRHAEMEWMLSALLREDAVAIAPAALEPAAAQRAWENDGGQNPSPPTAPTRSPIAVEQNNPGSTMI
jgi:hypothetical protein